MTDNQGLPMLRITVLGLSGCGKTALVNAFVNGYCPETAVETENPTLYYKALSLKGDDDEKPFPCVAEIEDTYSSDRGDGDREITDFFDCSRKPPQLSERAAANASIVQPFSAFDAPEEGEHTPLTRNRMAFLIVFDCTDPKSYEAALQIHIEFEELRAKRKEKTSPVVFLVANKVDKDPSGEECRELLKCARQYSEAKLIRMFEVSARENSNVKRLFRSALEAVRDNQMLWLLQLDERGAGEGGEEGADAGGCVVM